MEAVIAHTVPAINHTGYVATHTVPSTAPIDDANAQIAPMEPA